MKINISNYHKTVTGVNWDAMPKTLRKVHDTFIPDASEDDWAAYKEDEDIKNTVDVYFEKLGDYFKANPTALPKPAKKAAPAKKPATKKTAKPKKEQNASTAKGVEHIESDMRFIQRYVAMHGKQKTRKQILALLQGLQKAIVERRITKDSPYAVEIKKMEQCLKDCLDAMGETITIEIAADKLEKYISIAASEKVSESVSILKAYISLNGKAGVKEKADKLYNRISKSVEAGRVKASDQYYKAVQDAHKNLAEYLKKNKAAMHISQFELNGLAGVTGKLRGRPPGKKKHLPLTGIDKYDILEVRLQAKRKTETTGLGRIEELPPVVTRTSNAPVYSGAQIMNMHFETIGLQGKFRTLIGDPSPGFKAMIFGKPKQGKSTVAIMFARELARLGKVKYCALEEGISPTLKDKVARMGANVPNLDYSSDVGDVSGYKFVFIDSVSEAKLNADQLKELCRQYPKISFVFVFHATKGGDFRGGQQFAHDVDIIMRVDAGVVHVQGRFAPPAEMDMNEIIKKAA